MFRRLFLEDSLHIVALCAFAIAQPIFDLLKASPTFFIARKLETADLVSFIAIVSFAVPLILILIEFVAQLLHERLRILIHRSFVLVLVGLVVLPLINRIDMLAAGPAAVGVTLLVGGLFLTAYIRFATKVRTYLTVLAGVSVLFPVLFALSSPIYSMIEPVEYHPPVDVTAAKNPAPIVLIIFDELPVTSIMDEGFHVDADRFPGFAQLARESSWYRSAHSFITATSVSVPSILTAKKPRGRIPPTLEQYPNNLFTWLQGNYELNAYEAVTHLCPPGECQEKYILRASTRERMTQLLADVSLVYLHIVVPVELTKKLPSISGNWNGFIDLHSAQKTKRQGVILGNRENARKLNVFADSIVSGRRPALHYLHIVLPHVPWIYYPTGKQYARYSYDMDSLVAGKKPLTWRDDQFLVTQGLRRHLLQVQLVDRFVSRLIKNLKEQEMFDSSLIIVTADHGVGFNPGSKRKDSPNKSDSYLVPLFVKVPGQTVSEVVDSEVAIIDILPTIAETIGLPIPWEIHGKSLQSRALGQRLKYRKFLLPSSMAERYVRATMIAETFDLEGPYGLYNFGQYRRFGGELTQPQILGKQIIGINVTIEGDSEFYLDTESNIVPGMVAGTLAGVNIQNEPMHLAIDVNDQFRVVTQSYFIDGEWKFSALLPEDFLLVGRNRIDIHIVSEDPMGAVSFSPIFSNEID